MDQASLKAEFRPSLATGALSAAPFDRGSDFSVGEVVGNGGTSGLGLFADGIDLIPSRDRDRILFKRDIGNEWEDRKGNDWVFGNSMSCTVESPKSAGR